MDLGGNSSSNLMEGSSTVGIFNDKSNLAGQIELATPFQSQALQEGGETAASWKFLAMSW